MFFCCSVKGLWFHCWLATHVVSVILAFDRASGSAKSPTTKHALYRNDFYKDARVHIMWSDGETEGILFTYLDHGQCRDVYSGSSARAGPLVLKLEPAEFDSTYNEMAVATSLQGKVIHCLWWGEVPGFSPNYIGLLQYKSRTVDKALADLCTSFEPGSRAFSRLISVFEAVFILFLDTVEAGFVLLDAGPNNLALQNDGSVVFWIGNTSAKAMPRGRTSTTR